MAKSNRRVHLGDPEHLLSHEEAIDFISAQLIHVPESETRSGLDRGVVSVAMENFLNDELSAKENARILATDFIEKLEGNTNKFDKFTVEALTFANKDLFADVVVSNEGHKADMLDQTIESLPLSNGKVFNSYDMVRLAMASDIDFEAFAEHTATARFPKSWMTVNGEARNVIVPRNPKTLGGENIIDKLAESYSADFDNEVYKSSFQQLSDEQQDFVADVYNFSKESLAVAIENADNYIKEQEDFVELSNEDFASLEAFNEVSK